MPRKPRFIVPGVPPHVVQRGHNRQAVFFDSDDYTAYRQGLREVVDRDDAQIPVYVFMTHHVHRLLTPEYLASASRIMQYIGRCYVPYINLLGIG